MMTKIRYASFLIFSGLVLCILFYSLKVRTLYAPQGPSVIRQFPVMGTFAELQFYGDQAPAGKAADLAQKKIMEVEKVFNIFDPQSEASRLNASAAESDFHCSPMLWNLLSKARRFHKISGGAFDISCAPLMELWGFYKKRDAVPPDEEISAVLSRVGLDKVIFDDERHSVRFSVPGMRLDFGGIAKGLAVDLAAEAALSERVNAGIVNLGGNLRCLDAPPPGKQYYSIGIRNPFNKNEICGAVQMMDCSVSTSGNYEKYRMISGKKVTHIMNPKNGLPVENMVSVSVICKSACDADALSTSFFVAGDSILQEAIREYPSLQLLIVRESADGKAEIRKIGEKWPDCLDLGVRNPENQGESLPPSDENP